MYVSEFLCEILTQILNNAEKMLERAARLVDENRRSARYRRIKAKDFVAALQEHFAKGMRIVETLKI